MAMNDAFNFLARCRADEKFRKALYVGTDGSSLKSIVKMEGFTFTEAELGDALRSLELRAHDEFEAEEIKEIGQWYAMMAGTGALPCAGCHHS